jgi:hypothetical protein
MGRTIRLQAEFTEPTITGKPPNSCFPHSVFAIIRRHRDVGDYLAGIAYDPNNSSLWVSAKGSIMIQDYTLNGTLLAEFAGVEKQNGGNLEDSRRLGSECRRTRNERTIDGTSIANLEVTSTRTWCAGFLENTTGQNPDPVVRLGSPSSVRRRTVCVPTVGSSFIAESIPDDRSTPQPRSRSK